MPTIRYGKTSAPTTDTPGDTDFKDIWNYLKWLRKGYNTVASAADLPSTGELFNKGLDYLSGGSSATQAVTPALEGAAEAYPAAAGAATEAGSQGLGSYVSQAAPYAGLAAPFIAAYLRHQAGSGRNEPVEKRMEATGAGNYLANLLKGGPQATSYNDLYGQYKLRPKSYTPDPHGDGGVSYEANPNDPYTVSDLWHMMHNRGAGHSQNTASSGMSDAAIDESLFKRGVNKDDLLKALGLSELPDWSKQSYDTWFPTANKPVEDKTDPYSLNWF
jgi:hypothetical protein